MLIMPRLMFSMFVLLLYTGCSSNQQTTTEIQQRIIYGLTLEPSGIDPHINASSELGIPLRQVYDTLIYRDPLTKDFTTGLATKWEISDDGLAYTFSLREGVQFHDGTSFNAQAVATNLDHITNPDTASQKAIFMLGPYSGYEILDNYTIRILLSEPYSPLLDSLSQVYLGIASPKALSEYSTSRYQFHQIGTGPFTFAEYIPGDRIVLKRNPDYWGGPPFYHSLSDQSINEIEFRFFTDTSTRSIALISGGAQFMGELPPLDAKSLVTNSAVQLIQVTIPGQPLQFLINTKRFPTDKREIRQALLYGTNRTAIVDAVYQRFSPVAWGPLSASTLYYSRAINGFYAHNTAQAQSLLASAGFIDNNNDGVVDLGGVDLEISLLVPPWGFIPEVAQLIQDQWRSIGVRAVLQTVPTFNALTEKVKSGEYNLVAFYTFGVDPSILNSFFTTTGSNNWTGFSSAELDNILNNAVRQNDPNIRADLYTQAQRIIMDEALVLPIRDYVNLNAVQSGIRDVAYDAYGWFPILNNVSVSPST